MPSLDMQYSSPSSRSVGSGDSGGGVTRTSSSLVVTLSEPRIKVCFSLIVGLGGAGNNPTAGVDSESRGNKVVDALTAFL